MLWSQFWGGQGLTPNEVLYQITWFGTRESAPSIRQYRSHSKGILEPFWYGSAGAREIQWYTHRMPVGNPLARCRCLFLPITPIGALIPP
jgi:hypothetical protein